MVRKTLSFTMYPYYGNLILVNAAEWRFSKDSSLREIG